MYGFIIKKTARHLCSILIISTFSVIACIHPARPPDLVDDTGSQVRPIPEPQRIISLAPSNTEIAFELGLGDKLVGVTEYCNYPPEARKKTLIGGFSTVDIEKTVALQPNLILAADIHSKSATPALQKIGFNVITLNPKTLETVLKDMTLVGQVTGQEGRSRSLVDNLNNRIDYVRLKTSDLKPDGRPRVLLLVWHDPIMAAGRGTLIDDMINIGGGTNIAGDINGYQAISLEAVITRNPDVIIVPLSMGKDESPLWNYVNTEQRLQSVNAVKNGRIFRIDGDVALRYGPRSIQALEQFAGYIHPTLFPLVNK
jgi:iron complex transport system substrate-binding protein